MKSLKIRILTIAMVLAFTLIPAGSAFALTTQVVTITATPSYIAITNSVDAWTLGTVAQNTSYWWANGDVVPDPNTNFEAADMKSEIENTGTVAIDVAMHTHNFAGGVGWTLHGTTEGENIVVLSAGVTGCATVAAMLDFVDTTPQNLKENLAPAGTIKWCMLFKTGTFTDGAEETTTVTLTATQH